MNRFAALLLFIFACRGGIFKDTVKSSLIPHHEIAEEIQSERTNMDELPGPKLEEEEIVERHHLKLEEIKEKFKEEIVEHHHPKLEEIKENFGEEINGQIVESKPLNQRLPVEFDEDDLNMESVYCKNPEIKALGWDGFVDEIIDRYTALLPQCPYFKQIKPEITINLTSNDCQIFFLPTNLRQLVMLRGILPNFLKRNKDVEIQSLHFFIEKIHSLWNYEPENPNSKAYLANVRFSQRFVNMINGEKCFDDRGLTLTGNPDKGCLENGIPHGKPRNYLQILFLIYSSLRNMLVTSKFSEQSLDKVCQGTRVFDHYFKSTPLNVLEMKNDPNVWTLDNRRVATLNYVFMKLQKLINSQMNPNLANYKCAPKIRTIRKSIEFYDDINQDPLAIRYQLQKFASLMVDNLKELNSKLSTRDFLKIIPEENVPEDQWKTVHMPVGSCTKIENIRDPDEVLKHACAEHQDNLADCISFYHDVVFSKGVICTDLAHQQ